MSWNKNITVKFEFQFCTRYVCGQFYLHSCVKPYDFIWRKFIWKCERFNSFIFFSHYQKDYHAGNGTDIKFNIFSVQFFNVNFLVVCLNGMLNEPRIESRWIHDDVDDAHSPFKEINFSKKRSIRLNLSVWKTNQNHEPTN